MSQIACQNIYYKAETGYLANPTFQYLFVVRIYSKYKNVYFHCMACEVAQYPASFIPFIIWLTVKEKTVLVAASSKCQVTSSAFQLEW